MSARKALITGIGGQDGAYLTRLLISEGYRVDGLVAPDQPVPPAVRPHLEGAQLIAADLRDANSLRRAVEQSDPQEVYNLAGISSVAAAWRDPMLVTDVNAVGVLRLLEVLRERHNDGRPVRFLQASSGEMFGIPEQSPQDENTPMRPLNPYAVAKVFAHQSVATYRQAYGLHASSVILYNHESPLRDIAFVTRKVTRGVASIYLGRAEELVLGDLDIARDWGFAGDYVQAMYAAIRHPDPGDYVVATGVAHTIRDLLDVAFAHVGITDWSGLVRTDPAFLRPTDAPTLVGDATKAREVLDWSPLVDFAGLVDLMVDHDLSELGGA